MNEPVPLEQIRSRYAEAARSPLSNDSEAVRAVAAAFGYSREELDGLPPEANLGLSCGNPLALAGVREGETVLDLGCGGGLDVFLAARQVGPRGKAIGVDMTPEMLDRARAAQQRLQLDNVEFLQATIDRLPLPDRSVDCVISNCVINLAPDKRAVFREILRVLKPGGRVAISDIALKQTLPDAIRDSLEAYVGCVAAALPIEAYRRLLAEAGFDAVVVQDTGADLNAYALAGSGCCGGEAETEASSSCGCCGTTPPAERPTLHGDLATVLQTFDANAYAASVRVHAVKRGEDRAVC